mgnify:CR=1 FL=1
MMLVAETFTGWWCVDVWAQVGLWCQVVNIPLTECQTTEQEGCILEIPSPVECVGWISLFRT